MTIQAAVGVGAAEDAVEAAKEAIAQARASLRKENIELAIVFGSSELPHAAVLKTISELLGPVPTLGCSGAAIISSQGISQRGLAIMLFSFPAEIHLNTACINDISSRTALKAGEELGDKVLYGFHDVRRNLSLLFSDGLLKEKSSFIYGFQERLGQSFPVCGASASDNLRFLKTYVYFNRQPLCNAACGLLLGGKFNFALGIKHGWKPLGKPRYVTRAEGNTLYEIDGAPAAKTYEEYLACNLPELRKELKRISVLYPIGIHLRGEDEYLLRNVIAIDDDGTLTLQGDISEGDLIRLMIGTKESCLEAARQAAEEVKKNLHNQKSDCLLVFDSVSRYILLGRQAHRELEIIHHILGQNTPLIGIYTYGEQAPLKAVDYQGKAYFHNQAVAILGIRGMN
jgi:hypothetical protein